MISNLLTFFIFVNSLLFLKNFKILPLSGKGRSCVRRQLQAATLLSPDLEGREIPHLYMNIYKCFFPPRENLGIRPTFSLREKISVSDRHFPSKEKGKKTDFFPLLSSDFSVINPKSTVFFQPASDGFLCHAKIFREVFKCDIAVRIANIKCRFYARGTVFFSFFRVLPAFKILLPCLVPCRLIILRLYVL